MREWPLAVFFSSPLPIRCSRFSEDLLIGNVMMSLITLIRRSMFWGFTKWSLMSAALFWLLVYKLSQQMVHLPEFVYVNF